MSFYERNGNGSTINQLGSRGTQIFLTYSFRLPLDLLDERLAHSENSVKLVLRHLFYVFFLITSAFPIS